MIDIVRISVPDEVLTNYDLAANMPSSWTADQIFNKTGIRSRHVLRPDEQASDIALEAAKRVIEERGCEDIDFLLYCTEAPDFILPATACVIHHKLGLANRCGALDFNLGCSGYVYGLAMANSLIAQGLARKVLLLTADAYSKMLAPDDRSTRTLFGDAASATLLSSDSKRKLHSFSFGTDGSGAGFLINAAGGFRGAGNNAPAQADAHHLRMDGPEIFNFTLRRVPEAISDTLEKAGLRMEDIDHFVFHQANAFILEHLRKKLNIPAGKLVMDLENYGNTVSSTIPLCLEHMIDAGKLKSGDKCLLLGFGVGLSWASCILEW